MFYLTKRVDEKQCTVGEAVMVLAEFTGVPAGTKGVITEIYNEGVMVTWAMMSDGKPERMLIDGIRRQLQAGKILSASNGWLSDGFSRDELEYLAFETKKHPKVDPKVTNINDHE